MKLTNIDLSMTSTFPNYKLVIVDDHPIYIDGFKRFLNKLKFLTVIKTFSKVDLLLKELPSLSVDVIFLDVFMPESKGWDAVTHIKRINPQIKVIALSYSTEGYVVKKMDEAGIDGYIAKNTNEEELVLLFSHLNKNEKYLTPEARLNRNFEIKESAFNLTEREIQLVKLLAEERPRNEIAKSLGVTERTIDRENLKLFEKLGCTSAIGAVALALKFKII